MHSLFWLSLIVCRSCVAAIGVMHFSCVASAAHFFNSKGDFIMPDYKKMYFKLFNSVTDAIEILQKAQIETEEIYITSGEEEAEKRRKVRENKKRKP